MKGTVLDLLRGTALAVPAVVLCWLLADFAFARPRDLPVLLALAMVLLLTVAWAIHLKEDGFFQRAKPEAAPKPPAGTPERPFPAFEDGILERAAPAGPPLTPRDAKRALLWAAAELGLASVLFYH